MLPHSDKNWQLIYPNKNKSAAQQRKTLLYQFGMLDVQTVGKTMIINKSEILKTGKFFIILFFNRHIESQSSNLVHHLIKRLNLFWSKNIWSTDIWSTDIW
jgi:hypothetical protein